MIVLSSIFYSLILSLFVVICYVIFSNRESKPPKKEGKETASMDSIRESAKEAERKYEKEKVDSWENEYQETLLQAFLDRYGIMAYEAIEYYNKELEYIELQRKKSYWTLDSSQQERYEYLRTGINTFRNSFEMRSDNTINFQALRNEVEKTTKK